MQESQQNRLTIFHLIVWTSGIALALTIGGGVNWLRQSVIHGWFYPDQAVVASVNVFDLLVAVVYGTALSLSIFAIRSPKFWSSPGRIIMSIFGMICLIDWGISIVTLEYALHSPQSTLLFGSYIPNLPAKIGYLLGIPITLTFAVKARTGWLWMIVWLGFLFLSIAMFVYCWFPDAVINWNPRLSGWFFEIAMGTPIVTMFVVFCIDRVRRQPTDWWTVVCSLLLPAVFAVFVTNRIVSTLS